MIAYRPLEPARDAVPEAWTFPAYRHLLSLEPDTRFARHGLSTRVQPLVSVATDGDRVVGMALACRPAEPESSEDDGELLSLFVDAEYRRRGIATSLVEQVETRLVADGVDAVEAVYMTGTPFVEGVEKALQARSWDEPELRMLVLRSSIEQAFVTPWFKRYRRHKDFVLQPLVDLEAEIQAMRHDPPSWIAEDLQPWKFDFSYIEPASSLGIRLDGELVGWVINHKLTDDAVRFTNTHLRPDLSRRARAMPVLTESIVRAHDAGFKRLTFTVPACHPEMIRFLRKWCGPYADFVGETRGVRKALTIH